MRRPAADIEGATAAHVRLSVTLAGVSNDDVRRPSRLPGWTIGHVLTHIARNADSHVRMLAGAGRGKVADQYPGGNVQREGDIEAGAGRPAAVLAADVVQACERLEAAWAATTDETWALGQGRVTSGMWPLADLPFRRWREVEVHHADLGLAYQFADWPDGYVDQELARTFAELPARLPDGTGLLIQATDSGEAWTVPEAFPSPLVVAADRRSLLAWLMGRVSDPSLPSIGRW